jgi:hypothetical protein
VRSGIHAKGFISVSEPLIALCYVSPVLGATAVVNRAFSFFTVFSSQSLPYTTVILYYDFSLLLLKCIVE